MKIKERYICRWHDFLTFDMDWDEFLEWRDTMQTIKNDQYELLALEARQAAGCDADDELGMMRNVNAVPVVIVQVNDRIDESIEAYTAGAYLAGLMTDEEARRLWAWRENAEETRIE